MSLQRLLTQKHPISSPDLIGCRTSLSLYFHHHTGVEFHLKTLIINCNLLTSYSSYPTTFVSAHAKTSASSQSASSVPPVRLSLPMLSASPQSVNLIHNAAIILPSLALANFCNSSGLAFIPSANDTSASMITVSTFFSSKA